MDIILDLTKEQIIFGILVFLNIFAFIVMAIDKARSRRSNDRRISEGMMFFLSAAFASFGVYAGMFVFRHKTKKWYFIFGIPLLMLENVATAYFLLTYIN